MPCEAIPCHDMMRGFCWKASLLIAVWGTNVAALSVGSYPSTTRLFHNEAGLEVEIQIRDSLYGELHPVSDLVVQSFYDNQKQDVFKHMYRLAELNRLQQNFPYADQSRHRMLVAVSKATSEIVGFCDVDNRPSSPNIHYQHNPRPILSDLMVSPEFRRKGIARQLIDFCEQTCANEFKTQELYVRVLEDNDTARQMYKSLGYEEQDNPGDPKEVILMKKDLTNLDL